MSTSNLITNVYFKDYFLDTSKTGKFDGLTTPAYAVSESVLAGVRGNRFNQALMRKRQITLDLLLPVESEGNYRNKRNELIALMDKEDGEGELRFSILDQDYKINCVPEPPEIGWPAYPYFTVLLQFIAYDPIIYAQDQSSVTGVTPPGGGGYIFEDIVS